jgi:hypothetical protein
MFSRIHLGSLRVIFERVDDSTNPPCSPTGYINRSEPNPQSFRKLQSSDPIDPSISEESSQILPNPPTWNFQSPSRLSEPSVFRGQGSQIWLISHSPGCNGGFKDVDSDMKTIFQVQTKFNYHSNRRGSVHYTAAWPTFTRPRSSISSRDLQVLEKPLSHLKISCLRLPRVILHIQNRRSVWKGPRR